jgi:hypothetical protein
VKIIKILLHKVMDLLDKARIFLGKYIEDTSYILVFRGYDKDRMENLILCLDQCKRIFGNLLEIIIINQDNKHFNTQEINKLKKIYNLRFYNDIYNGYFNRGRALNFGVKKSDKKYIICGDIDIPLRENIFYLLKQLDNYDFINPYHLIFSTNKNEKTLLINKQLNIESLLKDVPKSRLIGNYTFSGGILICNKERLKNLNYFKEFPHYGCEDRHFDVLLDINKEKCFNDNVVYVHYYHNKSFITKKHELEIKKGVNYLKENFGCFGRLDRIDPNKPLKNHNGCKHKLPSD